MSAGMGSILHRYTIELTECECSVSLGTRLKCNVHIYNHCLSGNCLFWVLKGYIHVESYSDC